MAEAYDTTDLAAALPDEAQAQAAAQRAPIQEGWVQPQAAIYDAEAAGWEGNAPVYEFDPTAVEYGEVGPRHPELEEQLFGRPETRGVDAVGINYNM